MTFSCSSFLLFVFSFCLIVNVADFNEEERIALLWRKIRSKRRPSAPEEATVSLHSKDGRKAIKDYSDEGSTSDSHVSVVLLDQDVLECPICCEPLNIPIFQCDNGHLACSLCCNKVKNICPSCTLPIGYSRCRAMEKVIEASRVSCSNAKHGCKEIVSYGNRSSHEKQCPFSPCSCPIGDCKYSGSYDDLKNHVDLKHKDGLILFTWDTPLVSKSIVSEKVTIFKENNDGELIVVQGFNRSHRVLSVGRIAPLATEMGRFSCSLELRTLRSTLKQRLSVTKIQIMSEEQPKDDFMLIPSYMLRRGLFTMKICISRGEAAQII